MRIVAAGLACFLIVAATVGEVMGQDDVVIVSPRQPDLLLSPPGVRNLAFVWGSRVADPTDPANVFYNPAVLMLTRGLHASWNSTNWPYEHGIGDFADFGVSGRIPIDRWDRINIAGSVRYGRFDSYTVDFPDGIGEPTTLYDAIDWCLSFTLAGGYATDVFQGGVGFAVKPYDMELSRGDRDSGRWRVEDSCLAVPQYQCSPTWKQTSSA